MNNLRPVIGNLTASITTFCGPTAPSIAVGIVFLELAAHLLLEVRSRLDQANLDVQDDKMPMQTSSVPATSIAGLKGPSLEFTGLPIWYNRIGLRKLEENQMNRRFCLVPMCISRIFSWPTHDRDRLEGLATAGRHSWAHCYGHTLRTAEPYPRLIPL